MNISASRIATTVALGALLIVTFGCSGSSGPKSQDGPDGGSESSSGDQPASCDQTAQAGRCEITPTAPSLLPAAANICQQEGGTPGTSCPTANLVGCCTIDGGETCYYTNSVDAPDAEADCTGGGGSWATTQ